MCLWCGWEASTADHDDCRHLRQEQLNHAADADAIGLALGERWAATCSLLARRRGRSHQRRLGTEVGDRLWSRPCRRPRPAYPSGVGSTPARQGDPADR